MEDLTFSLHVLVGGPQVLAKGRPLHPFQWSRETALYFLWLIFFFLFCFGGNFSLVLESRIFLSLLMWSRRDTCVKWNGKCALLRRKAVQFYIWWGAAALNRYWVCSVAAEQTGLWFPSPSPKPLALRAAAIPSHHGGLSAAPTFRRAPCLARWAAAVRKRGGTGRRAKRGPLGNAMTSACLAPGFC